MLAGRNDPGMALMDRSSDIVRQSMEAGALVNLPNAMDLMPNFRPCRAIR